MNAKLLASTFGTAQEFEAWLAAHHEREKEIWLQIAKKGRGTSVTYDEALDLALAYGWIDGQKKPLDEDAWLQRFTPRGAKSAWSKRNRDKIEALERAGKMKPAGAAAVASARADGRWDAAYDGARTAPVPLELEEALAANPKASAAFAGLDGANRYAILYRLQTAKRREIRLARVAAFVEMLAAGKALHPFRSRREK